MDNQVQKTDGALPSLLIPMQGKNLIVPNVNVAEVVSFDEPEPLTDAPSWFLGFVNWRNLRVPLISFEMANSQIPSPNSNNARIAIINGTSGIDRLPYFAMIVQGIPRAIKVTESDIKEDTQQVLTRAEAMAVLTQLGRGIIPNMDYIEAIISKAL